MPEKAVKDFLLPSTGATPFQLSSTRGRKPVLYFTPKDNTPGCTAEGAAFPGLYPPFRRAGCERFKAKMNLPFELLADADESARRQFGVIKMKNRYGKKIRDIARSPFVLDENGVPRREWRGMKFPGHVEEVLSFVKAR